MALIKPDAFHRRIEIEEIILNEGFRLVDKKRLRFTRELAEEFYREIKDEETFSALVTLHTRLQRHHSDHQVEHMTSGDCMALVLARLDGIQHWRTLIGPTRCHCITNDQPSGNVLHCKTYRVSEARRVAPKSIRAQFGDMDDEVR